MLGMFNLKAEKSVSTILEGGGGVDLKLHHQRYTI